MSILECVSQVNEFLWGYVNFYLILAIGIYFTFKSKFFQFRTVLRPRKTFKALLQTTPNEQKKGISPLKLYFTSMGGSIGIGNIGGVVTAVTIGGPGGLFWMWVAVFAGMLVKYAEIYLGIKYRKPNKEGGYDGGASFYLAKAFRSRWVPVAFCLLVCIYGTEIYQFKVVEDVLVSTFSMSRYVSMAILLAGTLYVTLGGVNRLSDVCSVLMPFFFLLYTGICVYVIARSPTPLLPLLGTVVKSAFSGQAAVGGFLGSSFVVAAQQGMSNAVYSGDIGMGYDSVIQAETQHKDPGIQAQTAIFSLLTDSLICTLTVLVVLCTGQWCSGCQHGFDCVVASLAPYFPHIREVMALLFFLAGWTTVLGFLAVGVKTAKSLSPKGPVIYLTYAVVAFVVFSFVDQNNARLVVYIAGALLMLLNILGIFKLRNEIQFHA